MKIKTQDLTGLALDWAVTRANYEINFDTVWATFRNECGYSTDWAQGGPIIEREGIDIYQSGVWVAEIGGEHTIEGPTPLIAAMRCFVASRLGDEVEIPNELMKV